VDVWLGHFRRFWEQRLDALGTEIARGKRARGHPRRTPIRAGPTTPTDE